MASPSRPAVPENWIPISDPELGADVEALVLEVLRSGRLSQGPMVERFEALCAEMAGTEHAIAMANGTVTLEAALEVLGVGPGDEVITSPLTFVATLNSILARGATARFADVTSDFTLDPDSVTSLIGPRSAAVMPVHLFGLPCNMPSISQIAERHGLPIVEDAAQAHGAACGGRRAGSFGLGSFSFYATKNVTAGEGGVVTTSSSDVSDRLRLLRNHGMKRAYEYEVPGRNLRLSELHAAVAIPQLQRLTEVNARRGHNADLLTRALEGSRLRKPSVPKGRTHVWHQYTVLLDDPDSRHRFQKAMRNRGVDTRVYYPKLVWDHPAFRDDERVVPDPTPHAASIVERCVSLPVHQDLDDAAVERVAASARASAKELR